MMTTRTRLLAAAVAIGAVVAATTVGSTAVAGADPLGLQVNVLEQLSGYEEDPLVFSTTGTGQFRAHIDEGAQEISYELSYADLEGAVLQAHIHIGLRAQFGGISVFLCSNLGNGPSGTQACPTAPATISGTITPTNVIGPVGQGVAAGEFDELIAAIRAGATYVNVHSDLRPGGEIRAQLDHHH